MSQETLAAGTANHPRPFSETLRIREARPAAASALSAAQSSSANNAAVEWLRLAAQRLRKAWRWLERKRTQQMSTRRLRVAETISLGEKRSVSIVQVDGAQYLIGCSTASVQLLAALDRPDGGRRMTKFEGGL